MNRFAKRIQDGREAGFTLIELLIVIVILGILAGIAIFAANQFQDDASSACQTANSRINTTVGAANNINKTGSYTANGAGNCT